jgi:hypothetical protein
VGALGVVESQGAGERVEHAFGRPGEIAAFEADVVIHADAGQHRGLFAAQALYPPVGAAGGQAGLFGSDPGAAGDEESADLVVTVHVLDGRSVRPDLGGSAVTCLNRHSLPTLSSVMLRSRSRDGGAPCPVDAFAAFEREERNDTVESG